MSTLYFSNLFFPKEEGSATKGLSSVNFDVDTFSSLFFFRTRKLKLDRCNIKEMTQRRNWLYNQLELSKLLVKSSILSKRKLKTMFMTNLGYEMNRMKIIGFGINHQVLEFD